jgi:peroxiredoxin
MSFNYLLCMLFTGFATIAMAQKQISAIPLYNLNNQTQYIQGADEFKATVLWFYSPDCPLCQQYTLVFKQLQKKFGKAVQWYAISTGKTGSKAVKNFIKTYQLNMTYLTDKHLQLVQLLKARITPEVFVLNSNYKLIYSGRIDNWAYAPGKTRPLTSIHDLEMQLKKMILNQNIPYTSKTAIGCFIE